MVALGSALIETPLQGCSRISAFFVRKGRNLHATPDLVKYYIELYGGAFLIYSLQKYSAKAWLARSSSPKILPACPAFHTMASGMGITNEPERRGRLFELAVGSELLRLPGELFYWREKQAKVDFVYKYRGQLHAIEVKSGRKKSSKGLDAFAGNFPGTARVIVSPENFPQFSNDPAKFLTMAAQ